MQEIKEAIVGMGVIVIPLLLLYGYVGNFLKKEVLGFGDIKLVMGIGGFMGEIILDKIFLFYLITFLSASIYGILKIYAQNSNCDSKIPLAPFISFAGIVLCLF